MHLRHLLVRTAIALGAAAGFFGLAAGAPAAAVPNTEHSAVVAERLTITSFDAELTLGRDADGHSTLQINETIRANFPSINENHGIVRAIPKYTGDGVDMRTHIESVTMDGAPAQFERDHEDGFLNLTIGDEDVYLHGPHTFTITYTQRDVVQDFPDTDSQELYRDINGTGWELPFDRVTTTLHLEDGLEDALTGNASCYQGQEGDTDSCTITVSGTTATASAGPFEPGGNMTIAIGFTPDTFTTPPPFKESTGAAIFAWTPAVGALGLLVWLIVLRLTRWRNARGRGLVIPQYSPPSGLSPLEAAILMRAPKRSFAAQLTKLAVHRIGRIVEDPTKPVRQRYSFQLLDMDGAKALLPIEQTFLHDITGSDESYVTSWLGTSNRSLGDRLAKHRGDPEASVKRRGLAWRGSKTTTIVMRVLAAVMIFGCFSVIAVFSTRGGVPGWTWLAVLVAVAASVLVLIFAKSRIWLTHEGALISEHLEGLRDYIRLAEADRIRYLQSPQTAERIDLSDGLAVVRLHEKLLPYAILWGLEREWVSQLNRDYATTRTTSDWYTGNELVGVALLSSSLRSSAFMTTPTASSGSWGGSGGSSSFGGSMGGGFSGGGSGGGGGGGW